MFVIYFWTRPHNAFAVVHFYRCATPWLKTACIVAEKGVVLRPVCSTSVHNFLAKIQGPKPGDSYLTVPAKTLHPAQKNQQPKHHHNTAKQWGGFPLAG